MEKTVLAAVGSGIVLALALVGLRGTSASEESGERDTPVKFQGVVDSRYDGLPTAAHGFAPHGWITVVEPPSRWNPEGAGVSYPICPRPDWFPYHKFLGPPVPEMAVAIDPGGYMFQTPEGIRIHRDGWVVTTDGRAFRAEELIDDMRLPSIPADRGA